jgi:isocitrate dehydrogenase kinase/phosphatase
MGKKQVQDYVQDTRNDLGATLDEIEHRLSPAELTKSGIAWVSNSYDRNPVAWLVGGAIAVVGVVASVLWALSEDD